jgi:hypothetical protein
MLFIEPGKDAGWPSTLGIAALRRSGRRWSTVATSQICKPDIVNQKVGTNEAEFKKMGCQKIDTAPQASPRTFVSIA